jgi:hypothetical protein
MAQRPLIGTSPNQVSTNGMLGDLAFQDSNGAYIETIRGAVNLDKLDKEITDTAVDVFVYDTRKDSDGGAWRKRTQHTSWYNETLNTATRGSRREFPAVAVIVSELSKVTIYDGDDPDLPMWMVFNVGGTVWTSNNLLAQSGASATWSLSAVNGTICFAPTISYRLRVVNFISEYVYVTSDAGGKVYNGSIAERNSEKGYRDNSSIGTIVQGEFNDVAMTVLPNAPIDSATGLPIPTIAVATNGGVSVIKDDGTVVDITETGNSSFNYMTYVDFNDDNKLLFNYSYLNTTDFFKNVHVVDIPSADVSGSFLASPITALNGIIFQRYYSGAPYLPHLLANNTSASSSNDLIFSKFDVEAGDYGGLTRTSIDYNSQSNSMVAYATTSYNTGWMHGDIKGAFLSDTDATNVTAGSNLITSGDFSSSTGWTLGTGWTISGGKLNKTTTDNNTASYTATGLTVGKAYTFSIDVDTVPSSGTIFFYALGQYTIWPSLTTTGTHSLTVVATSTSLDFGITGISGNGCVLDNASLTVGEADRSVNNRGLKVFGTITKSAVATGAELGAYNSNWRYVF